MEAAFFDLDKTIISRSSSLALSRPLYRAGMVSRGQLVRGAYAQLVYLLIGADEQKMERLKEGMLALTKGWDRSQIEDLVRDVLFDVIDPWVYQEALDLIALHRSEGRRIYVVSSSPEEVVRPLARHFGASGVIATQAQVDDTGRYTGELAFYAYGEQKAEAIRGLAQRLGLNLEGSYAYSDSFTDVPMLAAVGNPVAVNPDKALRREAEERGWQIRDFRRPVRLRSRIAKAVPATQGQHRGGRRRCRGGRRPGVGRPAIPGLAATTTPELARGRPRVAVIRARVYGRRGCRKASARGAEPTRESCRGRHAQDPVAGRRRPPSTCRRDA